MVPFRDVFADLSIAAARFGEHHAQH